MPTPGARLRPEHVVAALTLGLSMAAAGLACRSATGPVLDLRVPASVLAESLVLLFFLGEQILINIEFRRQAHSAPKQKHPRPYQNARSRSTSTPSHPRSRRPAQQLPVLPPRCRSRWSRTADGSAHRSPLPVLATGGAQGLGEGVGTATLLAGTNVTTLIIDNAGHYPAEENPDAIIDAILTFL